MKARIFTDGASRGNPGPGGWGAIVEYGGAVRELGGREDMTTNNRMELSAVIFSLHSLPEKVKGVTVYTDSAYVLSGSTRWMFGWEKNNWKTSFKEDVLNRDLWEEMLALVKRFSLEWHLLKGHAGIPANERCDKIATAFADKKSVELYEGLEYNYTVPFTVPTHEEISTRPKSKRPYSYVSEVGGIIETHKIWEMCKERIHGVKGARFKKALTADEERQIIEEFKKK